MEIKRWKKVFLLLGEAFKETVRDQFQNTAGSFAYYLFLSIAPLIGFCVYISDKTLGHLRTVNEVIPFLKTFFTPQFVQLIVFFLERNKNIETSGIFSLSMLAGFALAYSTKEFFGLAKDTVELTWNKRGDKFGIIAFLKRILEDITVAFFAILIIFSFIIIGSIMPIYEFNLTTSAFEKTEYYITIILYEYVLFFTLFFFCFLFLPPVKVCWRNVLFPSAVASILQVIGREIMKAHATAYPDVAMAEAFLMILLWFYYSGITFIYSSEFAKVYVCYKQNIEYKSQVDHL